MRPRLANGLRRHPVRMTSGSLSRQNDELSSTSKVWPHEKLLKSRVLIISESLETSLPTSRSEVRNMKIGSCVCPACSQESLIQVIGKVGVYWRCLNQKCGQTFCLEQLRPTDSDNAISNRNTGLPEDHLEACKRYRIPTTVAGQIYELRRMFRL